MSNTIPWKTVTSLTARAARGANAAEIADAVDSTWREIIVALGPIVGERGVAALYKRSVYITEAAHPWLADSHRGVETELDPTALRALFERQSSTDAALGGDALFQTLHDLLTSLVGPSLTERLLRSVWNASLEEPLAKDRRR